MITTKLGRHTFENLTEAAPLHSPRSLAETFNIPAATIRSAVYLNKLDCIKLGKKVLILCSKPYGGGFL